MLGTAMIVSVLALSALALQRVQNRMLTASSDVRQAQQNAEAAIGLGLLAIKNDARLADHLCERKLVFQPQSRQRDLLPQRGGSVDGNLADDPTESILMTGVGTSGKAEQRIVRTVDAFTRALGMPAVKRRGGRSIGLAAAGAARDQFRADFGEFELRLGFDRLWPASKPATMSGSTYSGATTQVAAADRPDMPDW